MPIRSVESSPGHRVFERSCDGCGSPNAPFGTGRYTDALNSRDPSKVKCWCGSDGCQRDKESVDG